jgi:hypothetical protein
MSDQAAEQVPFAPALPEPRQPEPRQPEPRQPEPDLQPSQIALAVSVLLFVGLYLWGFVLSMVEMSQRDSTA